jgi:hypothetical protein
MQVTVDLCNDCHGSIHKLIPREKELGRNYYTLELLAAHPQMERFLTWVKRQK